MANRPTVTDNPHGNVASPHRAKSAQGSSNSTSGNSSPAAITSPAPNSTLTQSSVTFVWTSSTGASVYWLDVGTSAGGFNLFSQGAGTNTSQAVSGLPSDGSTIYVRLWTAANGVWQYNDSTYTASGGGSAGPAAIMNPAPDSTLAGSGVTFAWNASAGASAYWLDLGTTAGGFDLYSHGAGTNLSQAVTGLPTNGSKVYARLWTAASGVWQYNDYAYTTSGGSGGNTGGNAGPAVMISPAPSSTLIGSSITFTWNASAGASSYWLDVGTTAGGFDLYSQGAGTNLSQAMTGLSTNGNKVYVRLWTALMGTWQYNDYLYTASTGTTLAEMVSPTPGSVLGGANVTFTWSAGAGATAYYLYVGTAQGLGDIYSQNVALATSQAVTGIPTDNSKVYVRLWTLFGSTWKFNDYTYTAASGANSLATLTSPAPGSTLSGANVTFSWSAGAGATAYYLYVGTAQGLGDVYSQNVALASSQSVTGIPTDGSKVYVRLWTLFGSTWKFNDYTYTASHDNNNNNPAVMISPPPGSTLDGSSVKFTWSSAPGASAYWLDVGTSVGGFDLYSQSAATNLSQAVSGLPTDGSNVHVRLWTASGGVWLLKDYTYTSGPGTPTRFPIRKGTPIPNIAPSANISSVKGTEPATNPTESALLSACSCSDLPRLQDRLQKLRAVELLIANTLKSTSANAPATPHEWGVLQGQIRGYLQAMQIQGLTTFPDTSLFNGNEDPFCGAQQISAGACLDQDFAVHQAGHEASCRAGNWSWQTSWMDRGMLLEEASAVQKEMETIQETVQHLGCNLPPAVTGTPPVQPTQPSQPSGPCPEFVVVVQNVTTTSINLPGAITAQSGRSLNNGQGVPIALTFHPDGTFEGFGSGADTGSASGVSGPESVRGQFGVMQSIAASGFIRPGSCATQPCQPDVMHLVLVGGPSQQMTQMQARGPVNRDINETTATGGARLEFDLPAYIGGSAQRTFFASAMMNSYMTVNLVQGPNGTPALPQGSSLLYSLQQCKAPTRPPAGGGGGAAGVVIPGLEGNIPTGTRGGGAGIVVPGLEGNAPPSGGRVSKTGQGNPVGNAGIIVPGLEGGTPTSLTLAPVSVNIQESVHVADQPLMPVSINDSEAVHVNDAVTLSPGLMVDVKEAVHISDTTNAAPK